MVRLMFLDISIVFFVLINVVIGKKACNVASASEAGNLCSSSETCIPNKNNSTEGFCNCLPGFVRINETDCKNITTVEESSTPSSSSLVEDDSGGGSVIAGILIPMLLITVVICGIYISRKYKLVNYVRAKLNQRNNAYDEVMIGQDLDDDDDDPPLR